jgi:adenine-specific DNA-methyltransferase
LKLAKTNFVTWNVPSDANQTALEQHLLSLRESSANSATPNDLLFELLLKQGYSLTEKITEGEISGLNVHIIGENLVIAYLTESKKPTLEQLHALVDQGAQRIIMLEDAFHGDDELKTNLAQLCKSKGLELWTA